MSSITTRCGCGSARRRRRGARQILHDAIAARVRACARQRPRRRTRLGSLWCDTPQRAVEAQSGATADIAAAAAERMGDAA
jgi:hypothetical protein